VSKAKLWRSSDQKSLVEIDQVFDVQACEFSTFLDDGTVINTVNCESSPNFPKLQPHGFHVSCHPGLKMDQLISLHESEVAIVSEARKQQVRSISIENWKGYVRYTSRRFAEIMNKIDGKTEVPNEILFPERESDDVNPVTASADNQMISSVPT